MRLTDRETATVLFALRKFQRDPGILDDDCGFFLDVEPLTADEIDELAERINFDDGEASIDASDPFQIADTAIGRRIIRG